MRNSRTPMKRKLAKQLAKVSSAVTYPYKRFRAWLNHWAFGKLLTKGLDNTGSFARSVVSFKGQEYSRRDDQGRVIMRSWPEKQTLLNPVWWGIWLATFFWRWLTSRPLTPFVLALPACASGIFILTALVTSEQNASSRSLRYRKQLSRLVSDGDTEKAHWMARTIASSSSDTKTLFQLAILEHQLGHSQNAERMMKRLANEQSSDAAALWLAGQIGEVNQFATWSSAQRREYIKWLSVATSLNPNDIKSRRLLSTAHQALGDTEAAYATLLPAANEDLDTRYAVAVMEKQLGLQSKARQRAQRLESAYQELIRQKPQDTVSRTRLAAIMFLLEKPSSAVDLLKEGLKIATSDSERATMENALTEALVIESQKILRSDPTPNELVVGFDKLKEAVSYQPSNPALLEAIARICLMAARSENNELTVMREALLQGVAPDTGHFVLGTIALHEGNIDEGMQHLEIAIKNNPNLPGLLNNLAYALSNREDPDLERGLRLAEAAVRILPNHPYLRETRGQIYFKMRKYTEAIADLEFALSAPELRKNIRTSLAEAYSQIGREDYAKRQLELQAKGK